LAGNLDRSYEPYTERIDEIDVSRTVYVGRTR
jgi:hypothetical protein